MFDTGHCMPGKGCRMRSLVHFPQPYNQEQQMLPQLVACFLTAPVLSSTVFQTLDPRAEGSQDSPLETNVCSSSGHWEKLQNAGLRAS